MMPSNTPIACRAPIELAHAAFAAGNYRDVIRHAEDAIQRDPGRYYPWMALAFAQIAYRESRQQLYNAPQVTEHTYTIRDRTAPYGWSTRTDTNEFETLAVEDIESAPYEAQGYANLQKVVAMLEPILASPEATDADRVNYSTLVRKHNVGNLHRLWQIAQTTNVCEPLFYSNLAVALKQHLHWNDYARLYAILGKRARSNSGLQDPAFMAQMEADLNGQIQFHQTQYSRNHLHKLAHLLWLLPLGAGLLYLGYRIGTHDGWEDSRTWWWILGSPFLLGGGLLVLNGLISAARSLRDQRDASDHIKRQGHESPAARELRALMAGRA